MLRKLKRLSENRQTLSSERSNGLLRSPPSSTITGLLSLVAVFSFKKGMNSSPPALQDQRTDQGIDQGGDSVPVDPATVVVERAEPAFSVPPPVIAPFPSLWQGLGIGAFLVSGPVFLEAPLVRAWPVGALAMTLGWLGLAWWCDRQTRWKWWGDILFGFSLSWFAGAIYWGWFRWEPALHLPLESIGVPIAIACLWMGRGRLGSWFYLGSLLGTAVTDAYLWSVDLIPYWKRVMQVEPDAIAPILADALTQMNTPAGFIWAVVCASALLLAGGMALRSRRVVAWIFAGAVLNTLAVDGLFWLTAMLGQA